MTSALQISRADAGLDWDRTVPRALVHKSALAEVFLADSRQLDERTFACAVHLPLMHSFYNDALHGHHTLTTLLEAERQATILITERHLGVPAGYRSLLHRLAFEVVDVDATRIAGCPAEALLLIEITERTETHAGTFGLSVRTSLLVDDREAGRGILSASIQPDDAYRRLRRSQRARRAMGLLGTASAAPGDPRAVGKRRRRNVVLSRLERLPEPGGFRAAVVVDTRHPALFDHAYDHVPGMLLLEAVAQMAVGAVAADEGRDPAALAATACRATFSQFAEIELPIGCRAQVSPAGRGEGPTTVTVRVEQPDAEVCESTVDVAPVSATGTEEER